MLKPWQQASPPDSHRDLFLERHNRILAWALKLTGNRRDQADDLAQDTFVYLVNTRPDLTRVRDLDAYLYVLVRNLHRAQIHKILCRATVDLAIVEFDSADVGLKKLHEQGDEERLRIQNELRRICEFALRRKATSRGGAILILRFFLGYYPREIALVLRCSRDSVDQHLRFARKECRAELDAPRGLDVVTQAREKRLSSPDPGFSFTLVTNDVLLAELREMIFAYPKDTCPSLWSLHEIYRKGNATKPVQAIIAHIVCCARCLDAVNDLLNLTKLAGRDPNDTTGSASAGQGNGTRRLQLSASKTNRPSARQVLQWERHATGILEHRPTELRVAVNGQPLVAHTLNAQGTDFEITVPIRDQVDFVEVLSEQDIRLGMLVISDPPPTGEFVQTAEVELSEGRTLCISLSDDSPWPTVHLTYRDPNWASEQIDPVGTAFQRDSPERFSIRRFIHECLSLLLNIDRWLNARTISSAIALITICALLSVQTRQTSASAAVLVEKAEEWQRQAAKPGTVLHRTFDLIERPKHSSLTNHKRVEVWKKPGAHLKISHLLDVSGKLLSSVRLTDLPVSLNSSNAWQFEPAPDSFRQLAGDLNQARVEKTNGRLDLIAGPVRLELNKATFAPTGEIVHVDDAEFEFREISTEPIPESASPLAAIVAVVTAPEVKQASPDPVDTPTLVPTDADLEEAEVSARVALHALKADLGEEVQLRRRGDAVEISGVVNSLDRKDELAAGLADVAHLRVSLLAPEDLAAATTDRIASALAAPPEPRRPMHSPLLENWLEATFASERDRRMFAGRVLASAMESARHATAVRDIARRYGLPSDSRLLNLLKDHLDAIRRDAATLHSDLAPALDIEAATREADFSSWMEAVSSLFESAQTFESTAAVLFTTTNSEGSNVLSVQRDFRLALINVERASARLIRMN
jgi:RNA polymerase sigma factor (sigma-70 family)